MTFSLFLRPALLLALALGLTACGGKASFPINGTVTGTTDAAGVFTSTVAYPGLVLSTNGMDLSVPAGARSFSFPNTISYGEVFNVTFKNLPAHQNCTTVNPVTGGSTATDTAGRTAAINVVLTCYINTYTIGGAITGLTSGTLVLTNGSAGGTVTVDSATATAGAASYTFPSLVPYNVSYGVTVLTQPTGFTCTVSNPTGIMGDAAVTNINVACAAN